MASTPPPIPPNGPGSTARSWLDNQMRILKHKNLYSKSMGPVNKLLDDAGIPISKDGASAMLHNSQLVEDGLRTPEGGHLAEVPILYRELKICVRQRNYGSAAAFFGGCLMNATVAPIVGPTAQHDSRPGVARWAKIEADTSMPGAMGRDDFDYIFRKDRDEHKEKESDLK
jgi:hypothetical protein